MKLRVLAAIVSLGTLALGPTTASAQGIDGVVRLQTSGQTAQGVLVAAYTDDGTRVRAALTDGSGGFAIDLPPGQYRLQAERIGLMTTTIDSVVVSGTDRTFQPVEMGDRPIELDGLIVDSRVRSCGTGSREAARIQRWWSEVRTALGVSAALQNEEFGTFLVERFERVWDEDHEELIAARRRWQVSTSTRPFVSAPAEELLEHGFVRGSVGFDREYFGPDADVLLSTIFLNAHCFRLDDDQEDEGRLGLRFQPTEERRIADIEGTFWIDTTTATLTELDFTYANLDGPDADGAGGSARFSYLPSGAWIVSEWFISIPHTGRRGRSDRLQTLGYFDGGGVVTPLPAATSNEVGRGTGTVGGVVLDRMRDGPLPGAVVSVVGTEHEARTDTNGRFSIDAVPTGLHYLSVEHPLLDAWGVEARPQSIEVSAGMPSVVELATPTFRQAALDLCLAAGVDASTAITGTVVGPDALPIPGIRVQLTYEVRTGPGGSLDRVTVTTNEFGRFSACSAPPGVDVALSLRTDDGWHAVAEVRTVEGSVTARPIRLVR